jgi:hypothetical protein
MDTAYLFMTLAFGVSTVLGVLGVPRRLVVSLSAAAPLIAAAYMYRIWSAKDVGALLGLVGPFLVAAAVWYGAIGFVGVLAGIGVRRRLNATARGAGDPKR